MTSAARIIAYYLPQFHPISENDEWWGKGFTEWTNAGKARPRFPGHYQPHVPADLGFYDLRVPETRAAQAELARAYGVEAFCYYDYWFAGKRLLQRPFDEVVASGQPDFPFCLCWANETWTGVWHGEPKRVLIEQTYPGAEDHRHHFETLLPAFRDRRYVRVDGKPLFLIFAPRKLPDAAATVLQWREMAREAGLGDLHLVAVADAAWAREHGFDGATFNKLKVWPRPLQIPEFTFFELLHRMGLPRIQRYTHQIRSMPDSFEADTYPMVIPNWDNTPRSGARGLVMQGSTPKLFAKHLGRVLEQTRAVPREHRFVFIKSWNEWAEGNHLEPDQRYGYQYLEAVRSCLEADTDDVRRKLRADLRPPVAEPRIVAPPPDPVVPRL
jgi:lipopolysaccharide biosynthesis protein